MGVFGDIMGGLSEGLFGQPAQTYKRNPNDSSMQGAYGATQNLQGLARSPAPTAQAAQLNTGNYNQDRGRQLGLANMLTSAANGQGPSAAQMAGQQSRDAALSQAAALQAGRRGRSAAQGAGIGAMASSQGIQNANAQQAMGQANEMATARGQLGGVLSGLSGQDIGVAGENAGFQQATNLANQNAYLQNQGQQIGANEALQNQAGSEMGARLHQGDLEYSNLKPGSKGLIGSALSMFARGGLVDHPTKALIGEAGPEMVVPLSPGHERMRNAARAILATIPDRPVHPDDMRLQRMGGKLPHLAGGGVIGAGTREAPDWYAGTPQGLADDLGTAVGDLAATYVKGKMGASAAGDKQSAINKANQADQVQTFQRNYALENYREGNPSPSTGNPDIDRLINWMNRYQGTPQTGPIKDPSQVGG